MMDDTCGEDLPDIEDMGFTGNTHDLRFHCEIQFDNAFR